jgi:hypothetical protein
MEKQILWLGSDNIGVPADRFKGKLADASAGNRKRLVLRCKS